MARFRSCTGGRWIFSSLSMAILASLFFPARSQGSFVCMYGMIEPMPNEPARCGVCGDETCYGTYSPVKCESYSIKEESFQLSSNDACQSYLSLTSQPGINGSLMKNTILGVPFFANAFTRAIFPPSSSPSKPRPLAPFPKEFHPNGTASSYIYAECVEQYLLEHGATGKTFQTCINQDIYHQGEDYLEKAVCYYVTEGVGTAFCESQAFDAVQSVVNDFVDKYAEKPIVHAMGNMEDAALAAAKSMGHWFSSLF